MAVFPCEGGTIKQKRNRILQQGNNYAFSYDIINMTICNINNILGVNDAFRCLEGC